MDKRYRLRACTLVPLLVTGVACDELVVPCTTEGPTYEVSPPAINIEVGEVSPFTVIEITCGDRQRTAVYPVTTIADTTIAAVDAYYRRVVGRALGTTSLLLTQQLNGPPIAQIPIMVRLSTD